jgi:two-component system NarL family sensor kinase
VVLSRSVVYGLIGVLVGGGYALVVTVLSAAVPSGGQLWVEVLAVTVVVMAVLPLRTRIEVAVNERLFGQRGDPYTVISVLARRLEETLTPAAMLPTLVETAGQALRLPYVAVELDHGGIAETAAAYGHPVGVLLRLPLAHRGDRVGSLLVAPRSPRDGLNAEDRHVLAEVARHAGAVGQTVKLTTDLERSRTRLVRAREEERRRLLHDLHDGVGPRLAAIGIGMQAARDVLDTDPPAAARLLERLDAETQGAIQEIRRVAYDLRPFALDQFGLVTAVTEYAATLTDRIGGERDQGPGRLTVAVNAPDPLPPLPAPVEVAAYRIVCEALTNVARHAEASTALVDLCIGRDLVIEVVDDGVGLAGCRPVGVGLTSMRERAAELGGHCVVESPAGGGTRVAATLPLPR